MPLFATGSVEVSVPASSANLGPGFDSLGLALGLRDTVSADVTGSGLNITVTGSGSGQVPVDETHLVYRALTQALSVMGCDTPGIALHCVNAIPHGRGLGSSSAAIVAGICAARGLVAGGRPRMDDDAVFRLAAEMEGHPDNVAPAFFGGFTIAWREGGRFHVTSVPVDPRVNAVVFVPPEAVETTVARSVLPASVPHAAATANAGRAALLATALNSRPELLFAATEDRLHQDYREPLMPLTLRLVHELRRDSVAAVVSGAGPAVLAFTDTSSVAAMEERAPAGWRFLSLPVDRDGARVSGG